MDAVLHLEPDADPISGWLKPAAGAPARAFTGYLELLAALEDLRRTSVLATRPPGAQGGPA